MINSEINPAEIGDKKYHLSMSIEYCLRRFNGKKINIFTNEDGSKVSDSDASKYLAECQEKGWKVLPMGEFCEGFDYFGNGCPGHSLQD